MESRFYAVGNSTVTFNNTGTANLNTGSTSLTGIFPTSQLSGTINIAAAAVLSYASRERLPTGR